jgi:hypothetical protein
MPIPFSAARSPPQDVSAPNICTLPAFSQITSNYAVVMCNLLFASFLPADVLASAYPIPERAAATAALSAIDTHRPALWLVCVAHLLLFLQLASFVQCQTVHPGAPPLVFGAASAGGGLSVSTLRGGHSSDATHHRRGHHASGGGADCCEAETSPGAPRLCPRTSLQQPDRAMWVATAGEMVLGLDHYCFWIGRPIGETSSHFPPGLRQQQQLFMLALLCLCPTQQACTPASSSSSPYPTRP